jgi:hypothetical protein
LFCSQIASYLLRLQEKERRLVKGFPVQGFILSIPILSREKGAKITSTTCHNFRKENVSFKPSVYICYKSYDFLLLNKFSVEINTCILKSQKYVYVVKAYCRHMNLRDFIRFSGPWETTVPTVTNSYPEVGSKDKVQCRNCIPLDKISRSGFSIDFQYYVYF